MIEREKLGKRITLERKRLGYTQAEFGKLCGVGSATQYLYEKGQRSPNTDYLLEAKKHGADIKFILMYEEVPSKQLDSIEQLKKLFVTADNESRDEFGKLADLGARADIFEALLKKVFKT